MHELGIVFHVIKEVEEIAAENQASHVNAVTIELGEVSTVIDYYLQDCWKWAVTKHEIMTDCELIIEKINAVTHCESCGKDYETVKYAKICPYCSSDNTYLIQGNEFNLKEIAVV